MGNNFLKIDANNNDKGDKSQKDDYKNKEKKIILKILVAKIMIYGIILQKLMV